MNFYFYNYHSTATIMSHILTAYELNKEPTPQLWKSNMIDSLFCQAY